MKKTSRPILIKAYLGFANAEHFQIHGRVLKDEGKLKHSSSILRNLRNSYKRFESDEIPSAEIKATWENGSAKVRADEEGYFTVKGNHNFDNPGVHSIKLELTNKALSDERFAGGILLPDLKAKYVVVSDLDDTVIETGVSSFLKWRLILNTMTKNYSSRRSIDNVQDWYAALQHNSNGSKNPFFYVSNSPWNIYDYLTKFLKHNGFPFGPVLLRDLNLKPQGKRQIEDTDKYKTAEQILLFYPGQEVILMGDAAEIDTDTYINLAHNYPDRIKAIFIRSVKRKSNMRRVKTLIESTTNVQVYLFEKTDEAIKISQQIGLS